MPRVTLTFDNGPTPETTPQVLDCLACHRAKATFFVVGTNVCAEGGESLVRRANREGHWIGNHTFTHKTPLGELDTASALSEFERTEQALSWLTQPKRLFRPYGRAGQLGGHLLHPAVVDRLQAGGYTCVLWNCVPGDWRDPQGWVEQAVAYCQSHAWSLVVLHDQPHAAMPHLDRFLHWIDTEGIEIRQDYPPECVPIVDGNVVGSIDPYVAVT